MFIFGTVSEIKSGFSEIRCVPVQEFVQERSSFCSLPLTPDKIREFGHFTSVNPVRFDRLCEALKSLKLQF